MSIRKKGYRMFINNGDLSFSKKSRLIFEQFDFGFFQNDITQN